MVEQTKVNNLESAVHRILGPQSAPQVARGNKDDHVFIESDLRRPHQRSWTGICLEIAQRRDEGSVQQGFWITMANRMLEAQIFDFGQVEDIKIKEEAMRAGPLIGEGFLNLPYQSVIYCYTLIPDLLEVPELEYTAIKFCSLACNVVPERWAKKPGPGPLFLAADFMFVDPQKFHSKSKYVMMLAGGVAFQSNAETCKWSGNVIDRPTRDEMFGISRDNCLVSIADGIASLSMMLATKGVLVKRDEPTQKQQKARVKKGRPLLSVVTYVEAQRYYAAMENVEKGHHASPVPHLRRGHIRCLDENRKVWVRDTIVNCKRLSDLQERDHYEVKDRKDGFKGTT